MSTYPSSLALAPCMHVEGDITLPGSKSISNRTLLLAALCDGETIVRGLLKSDDTDVMLAALQKLGVRIDTLARDDYQVFGCGGSFPVKEAELFLGNAGTAFRPLTAALAFGDGHYTLSGVARMYERPIGDLVDGLAELGGQIRYLKAAGYPPLEILPYRPAISFVANVRGNVSSQFLSALLMALPLLSRDVRVQVVGELISKPYVDITLNLLARFGVNVVREGWSAFVVPAESRFQSPGTIHVEGDASSASYFLAAGAIAGGPVRVHGVGKSSIQGDVRFAETLARMGARIEMGDDWIEARAPATGKLQAIDADLNHIPDAAMTIAMCGLFATGPTVIRNIGSWRVKETDRIAAMAIELRKVGATVDEGTDYIRITPPKHLTPNATIDTYDDHRMAMCFSLVSLGGVPVVINEPGCVAKTFPDYFKVLASLTEGART
ncbi:MAG: 3-phosphoshikimate 1-carboxyvinyltransferase [Betaproteobacteria bacterium]|nr:3-phosphoshikimate 1-carboxyvinyltransferase [Betaproteobacteria bacterium]